MYFLSILVNVEGIEKSEIHFGVDAFMFFFKLLIVFEFFNQIFIVKESIKEGIF